jgi:hypothetical protein
MSADKEPYQVAGWNAAAIAAETSKQAAVEIIVRMELLEDSCDDSVWASLVESFDCVDKLMTAIYVN